MTLNAVECTECGQKCCAFLQNPCCTTSPYHKITTYSNFQPCNKQQKRGQNSFSQLLSVCLLSCFPFVTIITLPTFLWMVSMKGSSNVRDSHILTAGYHIHILTVVFIFVQISLLTYTRDVLSSSMALKKVYCAHNFTQHTHQWAWSCRVLRL